MSLRPGARLGPYEIIAAVGAGGMGEVYRARDPKLGRDVAIKVLPPALTGDADRLARFAREAQVLATLNHPNIASIYHLQDTADGPALVMELVEGETLAERIARGPISVDEALPVARHIAEALEAAHEQGIIHRDLKPANIKVRPDGAVKVLDFGLAKLAEPGSGVGDPKFDTAKAAPSMSPTITSPALMTGVGMLLGTAAYMAPEQAKGKPADKRSDIWAFGCVLYEMLTGTRAFAGDDVADTLAAVLRHGPDWDRLPASARRTVRWCLEKDPKLRLRDAEDAWRLLEQDAFSSPAVTMPEVRGRRRVGWLFAAVALLVLAGITIAALRQPTRTAATMRLGIELPENTSVSSFALSPDGQRLAVVLIGIDSGKRQLWLRALDSPDFQLMAGTDTAQYPFWSPDGRSIGFFADGKLKTISTSGGPPQVLCDIGPAVGSGGTWNSSGVILFSPAPLAAPLKRVLATGGECVPITNPEPGMNHRLPEFLPDGNHFFYRADFGVEGKRGVYLASLDRPTEPRLVLRDDSSVAFAPSGQDSSGHLLFIRGQALMAQRFDTRTLQLDGEPMRLAEHASFSVTGVVPQVAASASATGVLVYLSNRTGESELAWVDRTGHELTRVIPHGMQRAVALAPGGTMTALVTAEGITLRDLVRGVDTRFTFPPGRAADPVWSPDGQHLAFSTGQDLYVKNARDGTPQVLLLRGNEPVSPSDWSHDGRFLVYTGVDANAGHASLWLIADPAKPGEHKPVKFSGDGEFSESQAQISPNGRWIAYTSDESGAPAIYIRAFPSGPGKWRVSPDRGVQPRWRADGRELFYMQGSAVYRWMAVPVREGPEAIFESGVPKTLFTYGAIASGPQTSLFNYSPADDGQRFLVNVSADQRPAVLNVITNWDAAASPNDK